MMQGRSNLNTFWNKEKKKKKKCIGELWIRAKCIHTLAEIFFFKLEREREREKRKRKGNNKQSKFKTAKKISFSKQKTQNFIYIRGYTKLLTMVVEWDI